MKQAAYQARLDAANGDPTKIAEAMGEQIADLNAALQLFVRQELENLRGEVLLVRGDINRLRITQANMVQVSVGEVELSVKQLVLRFEAYERLHDTLADTLAEAVRSETARITAELTEVKTLIAGSAVS